MGSTCRRLTAQFWQAPTSSFPLSFQSLSRTAPHDSFVRPSCSSALRTWPVDICWPEACQEQRRCKAKAIRVSRKSASKGQQTSMLEKRFQKQSALHVQDKLTIDSPQFIIGYLDPLAHDMPWTWLGSAQWMWSRQNRTTFITELIRSSQVKSMLKEQYKQDEEHVMGHCRSLYMRIKDSYPRHTIPSKYLTKECEDAMTKEFTQLKREGVTVMDFKPDSVPQARMLQYRVFPVPKARTVIFQARAEWVMKVWVPFIIGTISILCILIEFRVGLQYMGQVFGLPYFGDSALCGDVQDRSG